MTRYVFSDEELEATGKRKAEMSPTKKKLTPKVYTSRSQRYGKKTQTQTKRESSPWRHCRRHCVARDAEGTSKGSKTEKDGRKSRGSY